MKEALTQRNVGVKTSLVDHFRIVSFSFFSNVYPTLLKQSRLRAKMHLKAKAGFDRIRVRSRANQLRQLLRKAEALRLQKMIIFLLICRMEKNRSQSKKPWKVEWILRKLLGAGANSIYWSGGNEKLIQNLINKSGKGVFFERVSKNTPFFYLIFMSEKDQFLFFNKTRSL